MAKQQLPSEMKVLAGLRLRAARLVLGIQTATQMAENLGVSTNAYNNYECGARLVDVAMAVRLLELTGIGPDWIYGGSTTGVPFDRAQRLNEQLQSLEKAIKPIPETDPPAKPKRRGRAPPKSEGTDLRPFQKAEGADRLKEKQGSGSRPALKLVPLTPVCLGVEA